jgi:acetyl-CoA synthetase
MHIKAVLGRSWREASSVDHLAAAAAVASPDERRGSVVKAFVVLADGNEPSGEPADEIKAFVRDRLSAYAYSRRIEFVASLPKTGVTCPTPRIHPAIVA